MTGKLTTHVLDTAAGKPGAGISIALHRFENGRPRKIAETVTNADGRTDQPLLAGADFQPGVYEITFAVGEYFPSGFFDVIPIRFRVNEPGVHYHVPLLCSPWSYSTYRGS